MTEQLIGGDLILKQITSRHNLATVNDTKEKVLPITISRVPQLIIIIRRRIRRRRHVIKKILILLRDLNRMDAALDRLKMEVISRTYYRYKSIRGWTDEAAGDTRPCWGTGTTRST